MTKETKVGLFLIGALALISVSIVFLGKIKLFHHTKVYYLDFATIEALPPKGAVKVAGVEIGVVSKVELIKGRARVTIKIDPELQLYANARVRIGSTGFIGTRFVELEPGSEPAPPLPEGSKITGESATSLNDMIARLSSLFSEDEKYGSAVGNMKATLAHIRHVSEALDKALGQRDKELEEIVLNIRDLTQHAKVFAKDLEEVSTERKEDIKLALAKFKDVSVKLDDILEKINSGEGTLGALINDKKTASDVKEAIASVKDTAAGAKRVIGRFTMVNVFWDYRLRYDMRDSEYRSDVGITFSPRAGKYYSVGVTNIGERPSDENHTAYEKKNRILATMGADYGPFTGYAGAIRSDGGFGLNFRPLWKFKKWERRLELNSEVTDFKRDRVVNGQVLNKAWLAGGVHFALVRWFWVGVRCEDILERPAWQAYANVVFRDDDFAYLLGLASVAR
jgi:phospholipid/cholesterol/gamma-HCH transport system substrate-binding protein